jgi:hypothetical protein
MNDAVSFCRVFEHHNILTLVNERNELCELESAGGALLPRYENSLGRKNQQYDYLRAF